jgi:hypothetical protein
MFVLCVTSLSSRSVAGAPYTFEGLANGTLAGQDNWTDFSGGPTNHSVTTVVPSHLGSPTKVVTGSDQTIRENDGSYSFAPHSASNTMAMIQFDLRPSTGDTDTFALGNIVVGQTSRLGPQFGIWGGLNSFMIRGAVEGTITLAALTGTDSLSDWYRLQLVVDFTANGGNGAGSLYVQNLTDGELSLRPAPVLSNVNLQILNMANDSEDPATWDTMYIRSLTGGALFDNLDPNFTPPVPEPSTLGLVVLGGIGMVVKSRRRRRDAA